MKHLMRPSSGREISKAKSSQWIVYQNWSDAIFDGYYLGDFSQGDYEYNVSTYDREEAKYIESIGEEVPDTLFTKDSDWDNVPGDFWSMWRLKIALRASDIISEVIGKLKKGVVEKCAFDHVWCPKYHNNLNDTINLRMKVNWKELRKWRIENQAGFEEYFKSELAGSGIGVYFGDYIPESLDDLMDSHMLRWSELEYFVYTACSIEEDPFGSYYKYRMYDYVYSELRPGEIIQDCNDFRMRRMIRYVVYQK